MRHVVFFGVFALASAAAVAHGETPAIEFRRDVHPILTEHCFLCHGPDEAGRKGGLRLDRRADALKAGESGEIAIVLGKPDASAIVRRIASHDEGEMMPPAEAKKPLTSEQIETLKAWVAQGAPYDEHWAFIAPQKRDLPSPLPAIDAFAGQRLQQAGLKPSPGAAPEVLCRRIYLDLVGLPPTPAEVEAFVAEANKDRAAAVKTLADKLLASPQFGEKWARHWLDVARYADSDGYEKDLPRQQWAYRDWVVRAINADLPYDQFLIEQFAGDLLPNATQDQVVATGFLRNSMVNEEGAIIHEQFRMDAMFDRMDAVGKAVLGLSLQCAQCHTHKYDPITHHEYYALFAFLNDAYDATSRVYTTEQLAKTQAVRESAAGVLASFKSAHPDWVEGLAQWEAERRAAATFWEPLTPTETEVIGGLAHPDVLADGSIITFGHKITRGDLWVTTTTTGQLTGLRLDALTHGDLPFGGPGRSPEGTFAVAELVVEAAPAGAENPMWQAVPLASATADVSPPARPLEAPYRTGGADNRTVGPAALAVDGKDETGWCPDRGPGRRNVSSHLAVKFAAPVEFESGVQLKVTLKFRHSGDDSAGRSNNFLGRFRLSVTSAAEPVADPYNVDVRDALGLPPEQRGAEVTDALLTAWLSSQLEGQETVAALDRIWSEFPSPTTTVLTLSERPIDQRRQTRLLDRGAWDKPTEPIAPGVLGVLHPLSAGAERDRLAFARWLASRDNPLAARVAVNRVWQAVWGVGLVETAEDFGVRGNPPSHPELLDWLAVDFMERGWSLKELLRTIVTSGAYQQTSAATPELLEVDPKNALLSRGPRFRPDAEVLRDVILANAGLLNLKLGGPYVFPPVPDSLLSLSYAKVDFWKTATGEDRYRRSLYIFRRRSLPDPLLCSFDAPNGDVAQARRGRSNTPLAALTALNEPVLVEASRAFALRVLNESGRSDAERAVQAFKICTSRAPTPAERDAVIELVKFQRQRIADGWVSAKELTTGDGSKLPTLPEGCTPADAAAWTVTARALLNLDETLTKN